MGVYCNIYITLPKHHPWSKVIKTKWAHKCTICIKVVISLGVLQYLTPPKHHHWLIEGHYRKSEHRSVKFIKRSLYQQITLAYQDIKLLKSIACKKSQKYKNIVLFETCMFIVLVWIVTSQQNVNYSIDVVYSVRNISLIRRHRIGIENFMDLEVKLLMLWIWNTPLFLAWRVL